MSILVVGSVAYDSVETPYGKVDEALGGSAVFFSAAASFLIPGIDTKVIAEIFSSIPAKEVSDNSDRLQSSAESIIGVKYNLTKELALHGGAGTELSHGVASPDWRGYFGLNWTTGTETKKPVLNKELRRCE